MERFPSDSVRKDLENELTHGGQLARQLQLQLNGQSSSQEILVCLLNEILNTYDRVLSMIGHGGGGAPPVCGTAAMVATMSDSFGPPLSGSPHSNASYNQQDQARRMSGERGVPRWTRKVVVRGETGNETQLDDGHSWRKYGQKDILRSRYSRGYYRCTQGKGCLARKQVQRSDEDPTAYEVTYKGLHTCHSNPPIPIIHPQNKQKTPSSHENLISQSPQHPFLNIQTSLKIIDSSSDEQCNIPSSSNFNPENINPIFPDDNLLWEDYFQDFMYPTAPEFNYFQGLINDSQDPESAAKPPTQDADSSFDSSSGQLGSSFGFGNSSYFP